MPVEKGMQTGLQYIIGRWGCDAVRDSDGTELPPEVRSLGLEVYSTLCLVRADQAYVLEHRDHL